MAAAAPVTPEEIKARLTQALEADNIDVIDVSSGCGAKFEVYVSSSKFENVLRLDRHRMVQNAMGDFMPRIHALTVKAWTPSQWAEQRKPQN